MTQRGPYAKGIAKREAILETALGLIARVGYSNATVKELADAVGSTPTRVIYYFGSKEALFEEVLRRRDELETAAQLARGDHRSRAELRFALMDLLRRSSEVAGLVQLDTRLKVEASEPEHSAHAFFSDRYTGSRWAVAEALRSLQRDGELSLVLDVERLAGILLAVVDGLQAQFLYDSSLDMDGIVGYLFDMIELASKAADAAVKPSD